MTVNRVGRVLRRWLHSTGACCSAFLPLWLTTSLIAHANLCWTFRNLPHHLCAASVASLGDLSSPCSLPHSPLSLVSGAYSLSPLDFLKPAPSPVCSQCGSVEWSTHATPFILLLFMHFKFFNFSLYFRTCDTTSWLDLSSISCNRSCLQVTSSTGQACHTLVTYIHTISYLLQMPSMDDIITDRLRVLFHMLRNSVENFRSPSLSPRLLRLIIPYSMYC